MNISRPAFVPFDEHYATRIYQRNLPHWRQDGATYFVTFRLADSIPDHVRRRWEEEKALWLKARGIPIDKERSLTSLALAKLSKSDQFLFQKHFNRQVQSCLDRGIGACHLRNPKCVEFVRSNLLADDGLLHHLGDFVIMPNHVHVLITPITGQKLEVVLKRIKGASAVVCNRHLRRTGTFWQAESHDHIVRTVEQLHAFRAYIAANPQKAGISLPSTAIYIADWMDAWITSS